MKAICQFCGEEVVLCRWWEYLGIPLNGLVYLLLRRKLYRHTRGLFNPSCKAVYLFSKSILDCCDIQTKP